MTKAFKSVFAALSHSRFGTRVARDGITRGRCKDMKPVCRVYVVLRMDGMTLNYVELKPESFVATHCRQMSVVRTVHILQIYCDRLARLDGACLVREMV